MICECHNTSPIMSESESERSHLPQRTVLCKIFKKPLKVETTNLLQYSKQKDNVTYTVGALANRTPYDSIADVFTYCLVK